LIPWGGQWVFLFSLVLTPPTVSAASKEAAQPDREMLRMLDFLRDMEVIRNMEMMKDIRQLEQMRDQVSRDPGRPPTPTPKKEQAK
jgi:hypothetical protein